MGVQVSPQRNGLFPDVLLCNGFPNIIHSFLPLKTCQHGDFDQHHLCGKQEHGGSLTLRERQFLEEYSKIARKQGKDAVIRRENKTKRRKKKNRP